MALKNMSLSLMSLSDSYRPSKKEIEKRICPHCGHALGPGKIHVNSNIKNYSQGTNSYCYITLLH